MSEVAVATMTEQEAQRLTERIRLTAHNYAEARQKLQELVAEAKSGNAHLALGYASWTAYLAEVLGEEPMRLARGERQEMVQMLSTEGMSTRAIAPIVGVDNATVHRDLGRVANATPDVSSYWTPEPDEPTVAAVQGMDGKTYTRPGSTPESQQTKPRAEAITSQFNSAVVELNRTMGRLHRITTQEAYARNTEKLGDLYKNDLARAVNELQTILNNF